MNCESRGVYEGQKLEEEGGTRGRVEGEKIGDKVGRGEK